MWRSDRATRNARRRGHTADERRKGRGRKQSQARAGRSVAADYLSRARAAGRMRDGIRTAADRAVVVSAKSGGKEPRTHAVPSVSENGRSQAASSQWGQI